MPDIPNIDVTAKYDYSLWVSEDGLTGSWRRRLAGWIRIAAGWIDGHSCYVIEMKSTPALDADTRHGILLEGFATLEQVLERETRQCAKERAIEKLLPAGNAADKAEGTSAL